VGPTLAQLVEHERRREVRLAMLRLDPDVVEIVQTAISAIRHDVETLRAQVNLERERGDKWFRAWLDARKPGTPMADFLTDCRLYGKGKLTAEEMKQSRARFRQALARRRQERSCGNGRGITLRDEDVNNNT
jgi:hypothetical protein